MERNPKSVEVGPYLLKVGGEAGTLLEQDGADQAGEAEALQAAFAEPEPTEEERAPSLAAEIDEAAEATSKIEQAVALCKGAAEGHALDPEQLALEVGSMLDCLERLDRKKRHKKAIQLARSLSTLLMLLKRWAALLQTLRIALRAGQELGDDAAIAWARHELGTLRLAAGDVAGADRELRQAREIRERIGDSRGSGATQRNMQVLCKRLRDMVQAEELVRPHGRRRSPGRALTAAAVCAFLFAGGVAAGSLASGGGGSEPVAETQSDQLGGDQGGPSGNPGGSNPGGRDSRDTGNPGGTSEGSEYTLTITIAGKGGGEIFVAERWCTEPICEYEFEPGTTVQFDYSADEGSEFAGFSGDCSSSNCTLTIDGPKAVTATFEPEQEAESSSGEPSEEGTEGEVTSEPSLVEPGSEEETEEEASESE